MKKIQFPFWWREFPKFFEDVDMACQRLEKEYPEAQIHSVHYEFQLGGGRWIILMRQEKAL